MLDHTWKSNPDRQTSLQYMSDLHLERIRYKFDVQKAAPTLILGGDIGRFRDYESYKDFLAQQCARYDRVLLVAGNHEFYGSSQEEGLAAADKLVEDPCMSGRLHFMDRARVDIPSSNVTILGCTLQSHIPADYTRLTNDFNQIQGWRVAHHNEEHQRDLKWLKESLAELSRESSPRTVVIVTHYDPAFEKVTHPRLENNAVSPCFSSHSLEKLSAWNGGGLVSHWIFGHTHWNASFKSGTVRVVSNQYWTDNHDLSWLQKRTLYRPFDPRAIVMI